MSRTTNKKVAHFVPLSCFHWHISCHFRTFDDITETPGSAWSITESDSSFPLCSFSPLVICFHEYKKQRLRKRDIIFKFYMYFNNMIMLKKLDLLRRDYMHKVGLIGVFFTLFSLFLIEVVSYSNGIIEAPNPLLDRTLIYIVLMGFLSSVLILIDVINYYSKR